MKNHAIKKLSINSIVFSGLLLIAFFAAGFITAQAHDGDGSSGGDANCETRECRRALSAAKRATAKYHHFQNALDDGFVQVSPCVSVPGLGAMGIHFANFARIMNPNIEASEPEILLYLPDARGEMRLVAMEYVVPAPLAQGVPVLFGQAYEFSPERNSYELHVWAWRDNPSGIFAPFNPNLSCPQNN
jgi:hypothetical protein